MYIFIRMLRVRAMATQTAPYRIPHPLIPIVNAFAIVSKMKGTHYRLPTRAQTTDIWIYVWLAFECKIHHLCVLSPINLSVLVCRVRMTSLTYKAYTQMTIDMKFNNIFGSRNLVAFHLNRVWVWVRVRRRRWWKCWNINPNWAKLMTSLRWVL